MPPAPPATPLSNTSVVGVVTPSGVCVPVDISDPEYWLLPILLLRLPDEAPRPLPDEEPPLLEEPRLAPELFEAPLEPLRLAEEPPRPLEPDFLAEAFLAPPFLAAAFLGPPFLVSPFLAPPF